MSGKKSDSGLPIGASSFTQVKELGSQMMECLGLALRETGSIRVDLKKMLRHQGCGNTSGEIISGENHCTVVGKIDGHTQIFMDLATGDAQRGFIAEFSIQTLEEIINDIGLTSDINQHANQ